MIITIPNYLKTYTQKYGWHFNKALCDYAVSLMLRDGKPIKPITEEELFALTGKHYSYDGVFVANMCKADYLDRSILDLKHLIMYVDNTLNDEDASEETTLRRWIATMEANKIKINWKNFL